MTTETFTLLFVVALFAALIKGQFRRKKKETRTLVDETWYDPTYYQKN